VQQRRQCADCREHWRQHRTDHTGHQRELGGDATVVLDYEATTHLPFVNERLQFA
jgi:hypothetical protein